MRLDPNAFARHLDAFAEPFQLRSAFACPCLNPTTGSAKPNCPYCGAKGWLWGVVKDVTAAVASSSVQQEWARLGQYESGDLVLSIPHTSGMYEMGQFDRVVHLTNTDSRSLSMIRGSGRDKLTGQAIKRVTRVFWFDQAEALVEGSLPTVAADGSIVWPAAGAGVVVPATGQTFSITYERYAEYFCFGSFSNDRMKHGGAKLPRKMVLRRFDLFGRTPSPRTV